MSAIGEELGQWLDKFAREALAFAHEREHWIDIRKGETADKYRDQLRYKLRVQGWTSAITFTYSVDVTQEGPWKHLSIQMSQHSNGADARAAQANVNAYKAELLELFSPIVKCFFPLDFEVRIRFDVLDPVPVANPGTRQVMFRVPFVFHFLVPWEGTAVPQDTLVNVATDCPPVKVTQSS